MGKWIFTKENDTSVSVSYQESWSDLTPEEKAAISAQLEEDARLKRATAWMWLIPFVISVILLILFSANPLFWVIPFGFLYGFFYYLSGGEAGAFLVFIVTLLACGLSYGLVAFISLAIENASLLLELLPTIISRLIVAIVISIVGIIVLKKIGLEKKSRIWFCVSVAVYFIASLFPILSSQIGMYMEVMFYLPYIALIPFYVTASECLKNKSFFIKALLAVGLFMVVSLVI